MSNEQKHNFTLADGSGATETPSRFVACVNACADLSNDELESGRPDRVINLEWTLKETRAERDALRASHARLVDSLRESLAIMDSYVCPSLQMRKAATAARAAITEAESIK